MKIVTFVLKRERRLRVTIMRVLKMETVKIAAKTPTPPVILRGMIR
jgi:hypothetical protein